MCTQPQFKCLILYQVWYPGKNTYWESGIHMTETGIVIFTIIGCLGGNGDALICFRLMCHIVGKL